MGQDSQATIQQKLPLKGTKGSLMPVSHLPAYPEEEDIGTVPKGTDGLWWTDGPSSDEYSGNVQPLLKFQN